MGALTGKRILLVEDEFIVAAMAEDMLHDLGATVIGPAPTVEHGVALAESEDIDAAVLDVNMGGRPVSPVVEALQARHIPMIFATGYGCGPAGHAREAPVLDKPYTQEKLSQTLELAMNARE